MSSRKAEFLWLKENPHFEERPATLEEFLGPGYLNTDKYIRPGVRKVLEDVIGSEVDPTRPTKSSLALLTGGIGIGKTTLASVILCYVVHWTLCLKDPQEYFKLMPGSRIAFAQASTKASQAKEVVFGDVKARVNGSEWFKKYPYDKSFKNQLRFPAKDIWVVPGDSTETAFEGYNVLGWILDEMDSHLETDVKSYAQASFNTLSNRTTSRFGNRGFGILIGQMKSSTGFASRKIKEFKSLGHYVSVMSIWESHGWDAYADKENVDLYAGLGPNGEANRFFYDRQRHRLVPPSIAKFVEAEPGNLLEIPLVYKPEFERDPVQALRDLAGIPPLVGSPFITLSHKIKECSERWLEFGDESPIDPDGQLTHNFRAPNSIPRVIHIDIGVSPKGDSLGFAMGHIARMVDTGDGELKPFIVFDLLKQWTAKSGSEIFLGEVRHFIYALKDNGFKIKVATLDGFQSTDFRQQLERRRIDTDYVSVDANLAPYYDLKDSIYENRIAWPKLMVPSKRNPSDRIDLAYSELSQLVDKGGKVDHISDSTKDLADAMAAVVFILMGDRRYHRNRRTGGVSTGNELRSGSTRIHHPAYVGDSGLRSPSSISARGVFKKYD